MLRRILLVCLAALVAGCGGGDGGGKGSVKLSRAEYLVRAQEIRSSLGSGAAIVGGTQFDTANVLPIISERTNEYGDALDDAADELDELAAPPDVQPAQDKFAAAARALADDAHKIADRFGGESAAIDDVRMLFGRFADQRKLDVRDVLDLFASASLNAFDEAAEEFGEATTQQ